TPIVLMGYYNPIFHMGVQDFVEQAHSAGVDGLIIVDLPVEEDDELCHPARTQGIDWVRLVTPTTHESRLTKVLTNSSGFLYYVSIAGITGTASANNEDVAKAIADIRKQSTLPIAVGFGIKTAAHVKATAEFSDAVVVGSAIIQQIEEGLDQQLSSDEITQRVSAFVSSLAQGLR
ncbi:MAG: tryptophan synthase alpha chain, partial [Gammaproteobacteria bacterium]